MLVSGLDFGAGFGAPSRVVQTFRKARLDAGFWCGSPVTTGMASSADVDSWKALGGKVDLSADKYVAPTGKQDVKADLIAGHETQNTDVGCIQANVTSRGKTQFGIWKPTWQKVLSE